MVFRYPSNPSKDFIKRVITIPGDTYYHKERLCICKRPGALLEPYMLKEPMLGYYPPVVVPVGHIFVMDDNRKSSEDSRFPNFGFVPNDLIKGKAMLVFWPMKQANFLP